MLGLIINAVLVVVLAVSFIVGLCRGFARQFSKGLCRLFALILAVVLVVVLLPIIKGQGANASEGPTIYGAVLDKCEGWFKDESFSVHVENVEQLTEVVDSGFLRIFSSKSGDIFADMQQKQIYTFGRYCADYVASALLDVVLWIICYLVVKYLLYGLRALLIKLTTVPVIKSLDKLFGLILSLLVAFLLIFVLLTAFEIVAVKYVPSLQPFAQSLVMEGPIPISVQEGVEINYYDQTNMSSILKLFHDNNVLGSLVVDKLFPNQIDLANLVLIPVQ